jgi:hypothetical protein
MAWELYLNKAVMKKRKETSCKGRGVNFFKGRYGQA